MDIPDETSRLLESGIRTYSSPPSHSIPESNLPATQLGSSVSAPPVGPSVPLFPFPLKSATVWPPFSFRCQSPRVWLFESSTYLVPFSSQLAALLKVKGSVLSLIFVDQSVDKTDIETPDSREHPISLNGSVISRRLWSIIESILPRFSQPSSGMNIWSSSPPWYSKSSLEWSCPSLPEKIMMNSAPTSSQSFVYPVSILISVSMNIIDLSSPSCFKVLISWTGSCLVLIFSDALIWISFCFRRSFWASLRSHTGTGSPMNIPPSTSSIILRRPSSRSALTSLIS